MEPASTQQPAAASNESSSPPATEYSPPISRITGKPMQQGDVDALYALIDEEIELRHRLVKGMQSARIPISFNHGIAVCQDGSLWHLSGEEWNQVGKPVPGSLGDLATRQDSIEKEQSAERQRLESTNVQGETEPAASASV